MLDFYKAEKSEGSLPSRERGLKLVHDSRFYDSFDVAPFAGARIEIDPVNFANDAMFVAPFAGARIEIDR